MLSPWHWGHKPVFGAGIELSLPLKLAPASSISLGASIRRFPTAAYCLFTVVSERAPRNNETDNGAGDLGILAGRIEVDRDGRVWSRLSGLDGRCPSRSLPCMTQPMPPSTRDGPCWPAGNAFVLALHLHENPE